MPIGNTMNNRERLVRTAVRLFTEQGYAATSVEDLLESSGVVRSNFYYHFDGKLDLAREVVERWSDHFHRELDSAWKDADSDTGRLRAALRVVRNGGTHGSGNGIPVCPLASMAFELAPHDPRIADALSEFVERLRSRLEDVSPGDGDVPATNGHGGVRGALATSTVLGALVSCHAFRDDLDLIPGDEDVARLAAPARRGA